MLKNQPFIAGINHKTLRLESLESSVFGCFFVVELTRFMSGAGFWCFFNRGVFGFLLKIFRWSKRFLSSGGKGG